MDHNELQFLNASHEIARHIEDAKVSKTAHFKIADHYNSRECRIQLVGAVSFVGIIIFWFISTQLFVAVQQLGGQISPALHNVTESVIPTAFAIAGVVSSTLLYLYRFGDKSQQHRQAAHRYHRFWRKCLNWKTEFPDSTSAASLVERITHLRDELSEINDSSPDIEEWAWQTVDSELSKGGTQYNVDEESA